MSERDPQLEDFGIDGREALIEAHRITMQDLINKEAECRRLRAAIQKLYPSSSVEDSVKRILDS